MRLKEFQYDLFHESWEMLEQEEKDLQQNYNIAKNMACSHWGEDFVGKWQPMKTLPDLTMQLHLNYDDLLKRLSFKRYSLIKVYWDLIKNTMNEKQQAVYDYWEEKTNKLLVGKGQ